MRRDEMNMNWKESFPVKRSEEHRVTRRQFAVCCGCSVVALGAGALAKGPLQAMPKPSEALDVAGAEEVLVGGYLLFEYPLAGYPCILVRLAPERYVAFSQSCTHLSCPVHFDRLGCQFICPCHDGYFDAENGAVIAGPPRRPLPQYAVSIEGGRVIVGPGRVSGDAV